MAWISGFTLRHRLWAGFALVLLMAGSVVFVALQNFRQAEDQLGEVVRTGIPMRAAASRLEKRLGDSLTHYAFYLVDTDKERLRNAERAFRDSVAMLERLRELGGGRLDARIGEIEKGLGALGIRLREVAGVAEDRLATYPGVRLATEEVNPLAQEILQVLGEMIASEDGASADRFPVLRLLDELRYRFITIVTRVRSFLSLRAEDALADIAMLREVLDRDVQRLAEGGFELTFEEEDGLERLRELLPAYFDALERMAAAHTSERWRMDAWMVRTEVMPMVERIHRQVDALVEMIVADLDAGNAKLLAGFHRARTTLLSLLGGMLALGFLVAFGNARMLDRLIASVREGLERAAEGDFTRRHPEDAPGEIGVVNRLMNRYSERMRELLLRLQQATGSLEQAADTLAEVAGQAGELMEEEHERIRQTAAAMQQMAGSAQDIAGNAGSASASATEVSDQARTGRETACRVRQEMQELVEEVRDSTEVIARLEKDSQDIGAVLDVIRNIAEQTNLLALNAAIEAARAGEQGRGFAVVADEVRSLANRTQESTGEIQAIITRLQEGAEEAARAMQHVEERVVDGARRVDATAGSLEEISSAIRTIADRITQIAAAAEEQSAVAAEINRNVEAIQSLAERSAEGGRQTRRAGEEVQRISHELRSSTAVFRVE